MRPVEKVVAGYERRMQMESLAKPWMNLCESTSSF